MLNGVINNILVAPQRLFPFGRGAVVDNCPPPTKPTSKCSTGGYCIKATCPMLDRKGDEIGAVVGYDTRGDIADKVTKACEVRKNNDHTCGPVRLTMLPGDSDLICSGQLYLERKGSKRTMISSG